MAGSKITEEVLSKTRLKILAAKQRPIHMTWGFTGQPATLKDIQACVGLGWHDILARLVVKLEALGWDGTVFQVKEKFGGLRFYIGTATDAVYECTVKAESESFRTCEVCGKPGKSRDGGWIKTRCDACQKDHALAREKAFAATPF